MKTEIEWHKYPDEKPREEGVYLTYDKQYEDGNKFAFSYFDEDSDWENELDPYDYHVTSWAELPEVPK